MKFNFGVLMIKVLVASFAVEFLFPVAGLAAVITVNSAFDTNGSLTDGSCSLREAIIAANSDMAVDGCVAGNGNDTIIIPVGTYSLTIPGVNEDGALSGDLDITGNLTLSGAGSGKTIIDAGGIDRVLHVDPACAGIAVNISGITIQNGQAPQVSDGDYDKAGGGGIHSCGNLLISDTVVGNNSAPFLGTGGGILSKGLLIAKRVTVNNNTSFRGGGIGNTGTMSLLGSMVKGNAATGSIGSGGGILNAGAAVLVNVTADSNTAPVGGGIYNSGVNGLRLINSTISNNSATVSLGAGIYNESSAELTNSTISGNTAATSGGGIANKGIMSLANVTIANNAAATAGGAIFIYNQGLLDIENSLMAGNMAGGLTNSCSVPPSSITSYGYNLTDDANTCGLNAIGDMSGVNALLGLLQDNGGSTRAHALTAGSPAVDAGNPLGCKAEGGTRNLLNDQRSLLRPFDGNGDETAICDIGAFEFGAIVGPGGDLRIQNLDFPDPVAVEGTLTYTILVTNDGPEMAEGIVVTTNLPSGVEWLSTSTNTGICLGTGAVECFVGNLFAADAAVITIQVRTTAAAQLLSTATVLSDTPDSSLGNNTAVASTWSGFPVRRVQDAITVGTYTKIQSALDAAAAGDIIQSVLTTFSESPVLDSGIPVTFKGGYDVNFSSQTGHSTIWGTLTLTRGTITVDNLILQ